MKTCFIQEESLKFSRAIAGILTLIAFFIHNYWLILIASILVGVRVFSTRLDFLYQLYSFFAEKIFKKKIPSVEKEMAEIKFVSGMMALFLFIDFLLLYFDKFPKFAWIFALIMSFLIFLACFVGFCIATLIYAFFKKFLNKLK